jgi:hypothetical protein
LGIRKVGAETDPERDSTASGTSSGSNPVRVEIPFLRSMSQILKRPNTIFHRGWIGIGAGKPVIDSSYRDSCL